MCKTLLLVLSLARCVLAVGAQDSIGWNLAFAASSESSSVMRWTLSSDVFLFAGSFRFDAVPDPVATYFVGLPFAWYGPVRTLEELAWLRRSQSLSSAFPRASGIVLPGLPDPGSAALAPDPSSGSDPALVVLAPRWWPFALGAAWIPRDASPDLWYAWARAPLVDGRIAMASFAARGEGDPRAPSEVEACARLDFSVPALAIALLGGAGFREGFPFTRLSLAARLGDGATRAELGAAMALVGTLATGGEGWWNARAALKLGWFSAYLEGGRVFTRFERHSFFVAECLASSRGWGFAAKASFDHWSGLSAWALSLAIPVDAWRTRFSLAGDDAGISSCSAWLGSEAIGASVGFSFDFRDSETSLSIRASPAGGTRVTIQAGFGGPDGFSIGATLALSGR